MVTLKAQPAQIIAFKQQQNKANQHCSLDSSCVLLISPEAFQQLPQPLQKPDSSKASPYSCTISQLFVLSGPSHLFDSPLTPTESKMAALAQPTAFSSRGSLLLSDVTSITVYRRSSTCKAPRKRLALLQLQKRSQKSVCTADAVGYEAGEYDDWFVSILSAGLFSPSLLTQQSRQFGTLGNATWTGQ